MFSFRSYFRLQRQITLRYGSVAVPNLATKGSATTRRKPIGQKKGSWRWCDGFFPCRGASFPTVPDHNTSRLIIPGWLFSTKNCGTSPLLTLAVLVRKSTVKVFCKRASPLYFSLVRIDFTVLLSPLLPFHPALGHAAESAISAMLEGVCPSRNNPVDPPHDSRPVPFRRRPVYRPRPARTRGSGRRPSRPCRPRCACASPKSRSPEMLRLSSCARLDIIVIISSPLLSKRVDVFLFERHPDALFLQPADGGQAVHRVSREAADALRDDPVDLPVQRIRDQTIESLRV